MVSRGYFEAVTYSFVAPELQETLLPDAVSPVLANPISSDLSVMRASLFPGLVRALEYNLNRQQTRVRLFETGLVFRGELDDLDQVPMLGALVCGSREPEGWSGGKEKVDFFDLKGDLESLIEMGGEADVWRFEPGEHPALHPGQCARVMYRGQEAGWIGTLHPAVRARLGLKVDALLFEVRLDALTMAAYRHSSLVSFPRGAARPGLPGRCRAAGAGLAGYFGLRRGNGWSRRTCSMSIRARAFRKGERASHWA